VLNDAVDVGKVVDGVARDERVDLQGYAGVDDVPPNCQRSLERAGDTPKRIMPFRSMNGK
jgi:hypothetical protein